MADAIEFEKNFQEYVALETGTVSLKKFVDFDFDCIKKFSKDVTNLKRVWNHRFKKFVEKNNIENFEEEEVDWEHLSKKIQDSLSSIEKSTTKRKRSTSKSVASSTSASPSSTTNTTKRRKMYVEFLKNEVAPEVNLTIETRKWNVGDVEVTKQFVKYRAKCIEKAKAGQSISIHEELSLNCIILVDGINSLSGSDLAYGFDPATWELMVNECQDRYAVDGLPSETKSALYIFADTARQNFSKVHSMIKKFPDGENENMIEKSLTSLISHYAPNTSNKDTKLESSFTMEVVYPALLPFLEENSMLSRSGTDGKVPDAEKKDIQFADISVSFKYGEELPKEGLVMVEIKPPVKVYNGQRPDYVKLGNELKSCIDKMVKDGLDNEDIVVTGILIEGFTCTIFVMDLLYQATYRMIPIAIFYLPRSRHDFIVLVQAFEALLKVRHLMVSSAQKCFEFHLQKDRKTIRHQYIVESIITPRSQASPKASSSEPTTSS